MFYYKSKVLIALFIVVVCNFTESWSQKNNANTSTSTYYTSPLNKTTATATRANITSRPSTRHYAIVNVSSHAMLTADETQYFGLTSDDLDIVGTTNEEWQIYESHLDRSSVIFGLTKIANVSNVNEVCYRQLKHIQRAIMHKKPWAMKVLDASGTKPSGFIFGQNFWLGSREACGAVQNTVGITLSKNFERVMNFGLINERAPFDVSYRVVYLRHNSPWQVEIKLMSEQIIHIGLCLPSACTTPEIQKLTADYVNGGLFVESTIYDIKPEVVYMKDLKLSESFYQKRTFKMLCSVLAFTGFMILAASFLRVKPIFLDTDVSKENQEIIQVANAQQQQQPKEATHIDDGFVQKLKNLIKCYDIQSNYDKMFITRANASHEIPVINGLRSVCAVWIMLFHVTWYMYFTVNNKTFLISYAERVFFQYMSSAPLLVDVFFTISGFLQTYNFMRNSKQMELIRQSNLKQNVKQFGKMLFHRYLRLAPLYFVVMGAVDLLYAYISEVSVFHIHDRFDQMCSHYWWRNILFIQNFFEHNEMCLNWTWSLACEMQYFVLATILLFIYAKHPKYVKSIAGALFAATVIWTYNVGLDESFQLSFDVAFATGTKIYISPFVRILPYIVGAVSACYLNEKQSLLDISDLKEKCLWNLAILIFFLCIYSTIKRDMSVMAAVSLFVIGRICFALSVCWMIIGSATGRGSWWSRILEAKVFQHVNRLTYAIYLLNPFLIAFFFSLTTASTHADPFILCVLCAGFTVIVYLASIVFSLAFEMPYCNWSSQMLRRSKQKCS